MNKSLKGSVSTNTQFPMQSTSISLAKSVIKLPFNSDITQKDPVFNQPLQNFQTIQLKENEMRKVSGFMHAEITERKLTSKQYQDYKRFEEKSETIRQNVDRRQIALKDQECQEKEFLKKAISILIKEAMQSSDKLKENKIRDVCTEMGISVSTFLKTEATVADKLNLMDHYSNNKILGKYGITLTSFTDFEIDKNKLHKEIKNKISVVDSIKSSRDDSDKLREEFLNSKFYFTLRYELSREIMLLEERKIIKIFNYISKAHSKSKPYESSSHTSFSKRHITDYSAHELDEENKGLMISTNPTHAKDAPKRRGKKLSTGKPILTESSTHKQSIKLLKSNENFKYKFSSPKELETALTKSIKVYKQDPITERKKNDDIKRELLEEITNQRKLSRAKNNKSLEIKKKDIDLNNLKTETRVVRIDPTQNIDKAIHYVGIGKKKAKLNKTLLNHYLEIKHSIRHDEIIKKTLSINKGSTLSN